MFTLDQLETFILSYRAEKRVQDVTEIEFLFIKYGIWTMDYRKPGVTFGDQSAMMVFELHAIHLDGSLTVVSDESRNYPSDENGELIAVTVPRNTLVRIGCYLPSLDMELPMRGLG